MKKRPRADGTNIILHNPKGLYYMQFRDMKTPYFPLTWNFFGGTLRKRETPLRNVIRELKEETGIVVEDISDMEPLITFEDASLGIQEYVFDYRVPVILTTITEGAGYGAFTVEELRELDMSPIAQMVVEMLLRPGSMI